MSFAKKIASRLVILCVAWSSVCGAQNKSTETLKASGLLQESEKYSLQATKERPQLRTILDKLGLRYLHQLDPDKVYNLNTRTGEVTVLDKAQNPDVGPQAIIDFGFGTPTARISGPGGSIMGEARTVVTCPFSGQFATVSGFMASTVSRDPIGGIRQGILVVDDWLDTIAQVNFGVLKVSGGVKNPMNRTTMESTHTGSCGEDFKAANLVATWPNLRVEMAIDDTGSMGDELEGVKTALAGFIGTQNQSEFQRGVSYELISFKDSPTLRLANTEDTNAAIQAVQGLSAGGGGDCPEDSLGAVNLALSGAENDDNSDGSVLLVTDASPLNGTVDQVISRATAAGVKVNVMLSGDCAAAAKAFSRNGQDARSANAASAAVSAIDAYKRLAEETGGLYFYEPNGTAEDYADILTDIFESSANGFQALVDKQTYPLQGGASGELTYRFEVPAGATNIHVITYGGTGDLSLYIRKGAVPNTDSYDAKSIRSGNSETVHIDNPGAGTWFIKIIGKTAYSGASLRPSYGLP